FLQERNEGFLATRMKGPRAGRALRYIRLCADLQRRVIDERALPQATVKELIVIGVGNCTQMRLAVDKQADGRSPVVRTIDEESSTIDGIDNPDATSSEIIATAYLSEKAILRIALRQPGADEVFYLRVGDADDILQVVELVLDKQRITL